MKYLFYIICLSILLLSCSEKQVSIPTGIDLSGFEIKEIKGTNASYVSRLDAEGNLLEEGMISNGVQDGIWVTYHPDEVNKIKSIANYVNGMMNGPFIELNNRNQVEKRSTFLNNQIHGLYSEYKFGRPSKEYMYNDGVLNGISKEYSDRGELSKETGYKNGKLHGIIRQYDDEGSLILEYEYKNGEKVSGGIVSKDQ